MINAARLTLTGLVEQVLDLAVPANDLEPHAWELVELKLREALQVAGATRKALYRRQLAPTNQHQPSLFDHTTIQCAGADASSTSSGSIS